MDIDAVIAEATTVAEPAQASPEAKTVETTTETTEAVKEAAPTEEVKTEEVKTDEVKPDLAKTPDSELNPEQLAKREANRQSHTNSKLAKMRRENRDLKERMEQLSKPKAAEPSKEGAPVKPLEGDYSTWGEFEDAKESYQESMADYKLEQRLSERETKQSEAANNQQMQAQIQQRIQQVSTQEEEFAKANPEYKALYGEYSEFMNNLPPALADGILRTEDAPLALYALMKEGKLEQLEDLDFADIRYELGKAEVRGKGYIGQKKQATNAPRPLSPAKGASVGSKSVLNMNTDELLSWTKP